MKWLAPLFFIFLACTKSGVPNYSPQEFEEMAKQGDPDLEVVIPKSISEQLVDCSEYTPPCRYGIIVIIKKIKMRPLYYDDQKKALEAAKRIRGYVARNWVLDDVTGEPVLERFVVKYLNAKKASEIK